MNALIRIAMGAVLAALLHAHAVAQSFTAPEADQPVALVADEITFSQETGEVIAIGSVEVYYGERTLTADRIVYTDSTRRIVAEGNITLRDPDGVTVFADMADLDADLRDGLVRGARSVLAENTRLAAVEARRIGRRYNQLSKAVYSPCKVCADDPTPLWRIRARRVIHDELEKTVHYESATFDLLGFPVFWLPYFQHPDPTVDRASGVLFPRVITSTEIGIGFKIPIFFVVDESTDFTLTPFYTTERGLVMEAEVRRAFDQGLVTVRGSAIMEDYEGEAALRGHIQTTANFRFGDGWNWGWNVLYASDDDYLSDFAFSGADRLSSEVFLRRYKDESYIDVSGVYFQSLRSTEPAGVIPFGAPVFDASYTFDDKILGGTVRGFTSGHILNRNNGRDVTRLTFGGEWERSEILPSGLVVTGFAEGRADMFRRLDDPSAGDNASVRAFGQAGLEARMPLIWEHEGGTTQVIEPIAQAIVAPFGGNGAATPAEDSLLTEFDENNVIDRNHFSGLDYVEEGPRLNLAVRYALDVAEGPKFDAIVGRVLRLKEVDAFSDGSGLQGIDSDYVVAWRASWNPYFTLRHRMRISENASITRNEIAGRLSFDPVTLSARYVLFEPDAEIGADLAREEVAAALSLRLSENWSLAATTTHDLTLSRFVSAGGTIVYRNECCEIALYATHNFSDEAEFLSETTGGLRVTLATLGTGDVGTSLGDVAGN